MVNWFVWYTSEESVSDVYAVKTNENGVRILGHLSALAVFSLHFSVGGKHFGSGVKNKKMAFSVLTGFVWIRH